MTKVLFFGDSLTSGENSKVKYTDFLPDAWNISNYAVSGTTIGEYSIYPVDGNSLLGQIGKHQQEIKEATHIFIEYGSNDVSAIMCGFATLQTVVISLVKAIDWIKQINSKARIIYLIPGGDEVIKDKSYNMCSYLENIYFNRFDFKFPSSIYSQTFIDLVCNIKSICDIMYMFDDEMCKQDYLSSDNLHPSEIGHKRIANNILNQV